MNNRAPHSPKIVQFRQVRTAAILFVAAAAIAGYFFYLRSSKSDSSPANTKDQILAIENDLTNSRAVLITADGSIVKSPGTEEGIDDREAEWRPDGNRVFISRAIQKGASAEDANYQIYRWDPSNGQIQRRTIGTRALAHPRFSPSDATDPSAKALVTAGGRVLLFDPMQDSSIKQILPPVDSKSATINESEPEDTSASDFGAIYKGIGTSFKEARWSFDKQYIVAVMRRDNGEALIIQKAEPTSDEERRPRLIVCADKIEFDVNQASNTIVFTVANFQWPDPANIPDQFKKGGKVTRPYNHMIASLDLTKLLANDRTAVAAIDLAHDDSKVYGEPALSPDGKQLIAVAGTYKSGQFEPTGLAAFVGTSTPTMIVQGSVSSPTWHPSGLKLAFCLRGPDGKHAIYEMTQGSAPQNLTNGKGDFIHPSYSPQHQ